MTKSQIIVIVLLSLSFPNTILAQWETIHPQSEINGYFTDVINPPNSSLLYAVGDQLAISPDQGNSWSLQENFTLPPASPTSNYFDICFTSTQTAFLISENKVYKSTDTGQSWVEVLKIDQNHQTYRASAYFRSLMFPDGETGFAVGDFNKIFKTNDGGNSWEILSWDAKTTPFRSITDVYFLNEMIGFVAGYEVPDIDMNFGFDEFVMTTVDGGVTWHEASIPTSGDYKDVNIQFLTENEGFAHLTNSQDNDETYYTQDGGYTWAKNSPTKLLREIKEASWYNSQVGVIYGLDYLNGRKFLRTADGGTVWKEIALPVFKNQNKDVINDIWLMEGGKGVAVGAGGSILSTDDWGEAWHIKNNGYPHFYTFEFANEEVGYATSGTGLLKTEDGGISWNFMEGSDTMTISEIYLEDENNGIFLGYFGRVYRIADGGFSNVSMPVNYIYQAYLQNFNDSLLIAGSGIPTKGNFLLKSGDGGDTWRVIFIEEMGPIVDFDKMGDKLFISLTNGILRSDDGGASWQRISQFDDDYLQHITFVSENTALAYFSLAKVSASKDGGKTWKKIEADFEVENDIKKFVAVNESTIYAVGFNFNGWSSYGKIWITQDGGYSWKEDPIDEEIFGAITDLKVVGDKLLASGGYGKFLRKVWSGGQMQEIAFDPLPEKTFGDTSFQLSAIASSSLPVQYTSSSTAIAQVSGSTVSITGAGETTITALQPGNEEYAAAVPVKQKLTVHKKDQHIDFPAFDEVTINSPPLNLPETSDEGFPITYSSSEKAVATINNNTLAIQGVGESTIQAFQSGNNNFNPISISRKLKVSSVTTVEDPLNENFELFPNPVKDIIILHGITIDEGTFLTIFDSSGQLIKKARYQKVRGVGFVDVRELTPGIYFLALLEDGQKIFKKFVKNS